MSVPNDYVPAEATDTTAEIVVPIPWEFSNTLVDVVGSAQNVATGVVQVATILQINVVGLAVSATVANPWGAGVEAIVTVQRSTAPTQEYSQPDGEASDPYAMEAQLDKIVKIVQEIGSPSDDFQVGQLLAILTSLLNTNTLALTDELLIDVGGSLQMITVERFSEIIGAGTVSMVAAIEAAPDGTPPVSGDLLTFVRGSALFQLDWDNLVANAVPAKSITYAKIQDISVTDVILGRKTAGAGVAEEIACTAVARTFIAAATVAAQRIALGLGDSATKNVGTGAGTVAAGDDSRFPQGSGALTTGAMIHVRDEKTLGTNGQAIASGSWVTREANTVKDNTITGASLAANQITLPAGDYVCVATVQSFSLSAHQVRLQNITDVALVDVSLSGRDNNTDLVNVPVPFRSGKFTIAATKVFEFQHKATAGGTGGNASSMDVEVYLDAIFYKVG